MNFHTDSGKKFKTDQDANVYISTQSQNTVRYTNYISEKFQKRLNNLEQINSKLVLRMNEMVAIDQSFHDTNIKYLALKEKVLETEEKLLMNGIDTSKYSAFYKGEQDANSGVKIIKDSKFKILLECEVDIENKNPVNKYTQNDASFFFTQEQLIKGTLN